MRELDGGPDQERSCDGQWLGVVETGRGAANVDSASTSCHPSTWSSRS